MLSDCDKWRINKWTKGIIAEYGMERLQKMGPIAIVDHLLGGAESVGDTGTRSYRDLKDNRLEAEEIIGGILGMM